MVKMSRSSLLTKILEINNQKMFGRKYLKLGLKQLFLKTISAFLRFCDLFFDAFCDLFQKLRLDIIQ